MGAAIAGALLGPVIGVAADLTSFELVFCSIALIGVGLMAWTWRTPAAAPLGDGSLRGLAGALRNGQVRTGLALITVPGLLFGTLSVLGPLRLDELGATTAAIGAIWLMAAALEAIVSPLAGRFSDRRGQLAPLLGGLVGGAITFALLPWPSDAVTLGILIVRGLAGDRPAVGALDVDALRRRRRGRARAGAGVRADEPDVGDGPGRRRRRRRAARPGRGGRGRLPRALGDLHPGVRRAPRAVAALPRRHREGGFRARSRRGGRRG